MTQQSNTPETDEHISSNMAICGHAIVCHDFAMRLERERDEYKQLLADTLKSDAPLVERLKLELEQLRKVADELADSLNRSNYYYSVQQYNNLPHVIARNKAK